MRTCIYRHLLIAARLHLIVCRHSQLALVVVPVSWLAGRSHVARSLWPIPVDGGRRRADVIDDVTRSTSRSNSDGGVSLFSGLDRGRHIIIISISSSSRTDYHTQLSTSQLVCCYRQDLPEGQLNRYCFYSRADFRVFRPAGATRCTDQGEIWHGGA